MAIATALWTDPADIARELTALGFSVAAMRDIALVWGAAMRSGTRHLPRTFPATAAWAHSTSRLRDHGVRTGYSPEFERGVELCVNKETGIAIVFCSGNSATGDHRMTPSTKHPRGTCSREVLLAQTAFFWRRDDRPENAKRYTTWIMLARMTDGKVYTEFSWPATVSAYGHVGRWHARIILPVIDLNAPRAPESAIDDVELSEEIDIVVKPRK
jgi:hypothetical protein